jgi:thiosulfate/3-mercaptopyruvate sulfurtransferase
MTDQPIVSTQWLHDHLDDPNLRVVDIRGHVLPASEPPPHYFAHHEAFAESHIPGAVFVDWTADITDPESPHGTQIAQPAAYADLMNRLGIDDDTFVVVYDDANNMFAARLWWSLRYYGHEDVAVLDGGWHKWTAEDRPVTEEVTTVSPATFTPRPQPHLRFTVNDVAADLRDRSAMLLDVRSTGEYNGDTSRASRKGHIPGAVNLPRGQMVGSDGTVPTPEVLRARFAQVGITPEASEVVVYCNAGVSASYGLLALHIAGIKNAAVYDGSWKEWGNDDSRPIA